MFDFSSDAEGSLAGSERSGGWAVGAVGSAARAALGTAARPCSGLGPMASPL